MSLPTGPRLILLTPGDHLTLCLSALSCTPGPFWRCADENWGGSPKSKVSFLAGINKPTSVSEPSFLPRTVLMIRVVVVLEELQPSSVRGPFSGASPVPYGRFYLLSSAAARLRG